jgi:hypothetical protein
MKQKGATYGGTCSLESEIVRDKKQSDNNSARSCADNSCLVLVVALCTAESFSFRITDLKIHRLFHRIPGYRNGQADIHVDGIMGAKRHKSDCV